MILNHCLEQYMRKPACTHSKCAIGCWMTAQVGAVQDEVELELSSAAGAASCAAVLARC